MYKVWNNLECFVKDHAYTRRQIVQRQCGGCARCEVEHDCSRISSAGFGLDSLTGQKTVKIGDNDVGA